jgi:DNA-binding NarL/FixJ family response regulator
VYRSVPSISIAIAKFDDLLALGLKAMLEGDPALSLVASDVAYGRLHPTLRTHHPHVLIADARSLRDLAQVRELSASFPDTHLVLFTEDLAAAETGQLLAFGASACLARNTQTRDLLNTIHLVSRGLQVVPREVQLARGSSASDTRLTRRESDVLVLLRQGLGNGQIALELDIGVETVRTHARHIYRKMGVVSRRSLLALPAA